MSHLAFSKAHGYEINPFLVWWSRRKIKKAGLEARAFIHFQNFWRTDFAQFDIVVLFGINHIMRRLEKKLRAELKPDARVLSYAFSFPTWPFFAKQAGIFLYKT